MSSIKIALVDDHILLRNGLAGMLRESGYNVLFEADNGKDFIAKLEKSASPDIVLLDINMQVMDGYDTADWIRKRHPQIQMLALSMYDEEDAIIRMLKNGVRGYILKDAHPSELKAAIDAIMTRGFYYSEMVTGRLMRSVIDDDNTGNTAARMLSDREKDFLKLAATELTYKEIAVKMHLTPRVIDNFRDSLFDKLDVKSRVGLAIYAVKNGVVTF